MLDLETEVRETVLSRIAKDIHELWVDKEVALITGLKMLHQGKYREAAERIEEADRISIALTYYKSYLTLEYKKVVSLH